MPRKRRPATLPKVTLKNINRLEQHGHGWNVHVKRRYREFKKHFPDGADGPFESLRLAIAWRDRTWARLGPPSHAPASSRRQSGPVIGVWRELVRNQLGRVYYVWRTQWHDATLRVRRRCFSVDAYGEAEAKQMAVRARQEGIRVSEKERRRRMLDALHVHQKVLPPTAPTELDIVAPPGRKRRPSRLPKVTLKNINRIENDGIGWRVQMKRRYRAVTQHFSDDADGPFTSLRDAIACRDALWQRLGPPTHSAERSKRSTSPTVGVYREVQRIRSGRIVETWNARWLDASGKRRRKSFTIDKFGEDEAYAKAVAARQEGLKATEQERRKRMLNVLHTHRAVLSGRARRS